jgi:hypothetical protein
MFRLINKPSSGVSQLHYLKTHPHISSLCKYIVTTITFNCTVTKSDFTKISDIVD